MKMTLMIEGSASVLAAILANLPDGAAVASPGIGGPGSVGDQTPVPSPLPMPSNPTGGEDDDAGDDDNGPVNTAAPATDVNGLPWDERIHAATKSTNADGSWKKRKGGPKGDQLAAIEAELRARAAPPMPPAATPIPAPAPMPAPMPIGMPSPNPAPVPPPIPAAAPIPPAMPAPVPMASDVPAATTAASPMPMPAPVAPPMPAPAPVAAAPQLPTAAAIETAAGAATGTLDFAQFMQHLSGQMGKKDGAGAPLVHTDYLAQITAEIAGAFGVSMSAITDIATDPRMITFAMQAMQRDGRW